MDEQKKTFAKKIFQYFFQGIIVIAPIAVTIYFVFWLFTAVDSILPNLFGTVVPGEASRWHIPGLGILMMVIIMILVGWASSSFVISHILDLIGSALEKTPGVKLIYSSVTPPDMTNFIASAEEICSLIILILVLGTKKVIPDIA